MAGTPRKLLQATDMLPRATSFLTDEYRFLAWQTWLGESAESQQRIALWRRVTRL